MRPFARVPTKSEVYLGEGLLSEVADKAANAGFRFVLVKNKVYALESERAPGSSLGLHWLKGAKLAE
jgi:hypothetical protein